MSDTPNEPAAQDLWNNSSEFYLEGRTPLGAVDYGVFAPSESDLHLLSDAVGDVRGLCILDAGCGGGANAVRLAELGAHVTALDFSEPQLAHAERAAKKAGADIDFVLGDIETLADIADASQDAVLCTHVLAYVEHAELALASIRRVLRPGGTLIASTDHPVRQCFYEEDSSDMTNYPERSYYDTGPRRWAFVRGGPVMRSYERTVSQWVELLQAAGLPLLRMVEPATPAEVLDEFFPEDGPLASLRNIPHTLILVAAKSGNNPTQA